MVQAAGWITSGQRWQVYGMTKHLCDIREGWKSHWFGDNLIIMNDEGVILTYHVKDIKRGELLPRENDSHI